MSVPRRLEEFLQEHGVKYEIMPHSASYTAQETAASVHLPGKEMAKTVIVKDSGHYVMAVLDAPHRLDLEKLARLPGLEKPSLAGESELRELFPDCELGAMPPFGQLYGLKVYLDRRLEQDEEIVFNAGSHHEVVRMKFADYKNLAQPVIGDITIE